LFVLALRLAAGSLTYWPSNRHNRHPRPHMATRTRNREFVDGSEKFCTRFSDTDRSLIFAALDPIDRSIHTPPAQHSSSSILHCYANCNIQCVYRIEPPFFTTARSRHSVHDSVFEDFAGKPFRGRHLKIVAMAPS
jgi:hypothetical protein